MQRILKRTRLFSCGSLLLLISFFVHALCDRCDAQMKLWDIFRRQEAKIDLENEIIVAQQISNSKFDK